jgi:hypothetical protein
VFDRKARKAALEQAQRAAAEGIAATRRAQVAERAAHQEQLNATWEALNANDPDTVLAALAAAFEDNEAAAAAIGVAGSEVRLVVVVPPMSSIPERRPTTTSAGNLSLKKYTKRETCDLYKLLVCGHAPVTLKEAFAVAPGLRSARVVALRPAPTDAYGKTKPEVLLAALFEKAALAGIRWAEANAVQVVNDVSSADLHPEGHLPAADSGRPGEGAGATCPG